MGRLLPRTMSVAYSGQLGVGSSILLLGVSRLCSVMLTSLSMLPLTKAALIVVPVIFWWCRRVMTVVCVLIRFRLR